MIREQRGLLGFSLIEIVGGVIGVLALVAAVVYVNSLLKQHYNGPLIAKYAPLAEACKALKNEQPEDCAVALRAAVTGRDTCLAANKSLDEQFATFRQMHNASVQALSDEYDRAKAARAQRTAEIAPKLAELSMERFNMIAAAKGKGLSCPEYDALLLKEMERKLRDFGPATEPATDGPRIVEPTKTNPGVEPTKSAPVNPLRPKP